MKPHNKRVTFKFDSGASGNYVRPEDAHILDNVMNEQGPPVTLPDSSTTTATHSGELPLSSQLSKEAQKATVLPQLKSCSLLSTGKTCDDGNMVVFQKDDVRAIKSTPEVREIINKQPIILKGNRNPVDNLWEMKLQAPASRYKTAIQENVYCLPQTHPSLYSERKLQNDRKELKHFSFSKKSIPVQKQEKDNFDSILEEQRQKDVMNHQRIHLNNDKLNVIIKKDATQK